MRTAIAALLGAMVFVAACQAKAATGTQAPQPGYQVMPWAAGKAVPGFQATDMNGKVWRLSDLRGRAVLINFWASWCEPCRAEMPSLQQLAAQQPDTLVVLAVNLKESESTVLRFVQRTGLTLPVVRDTEGAVARAWGVSIYPSTVLIDAKGRVKSVVRGEVDWVGADAARLLAPLYLQKPAP